MLVACPLMHGTGQFSALIAMTVGGAVVTLANRRLRCRRAVLDRRATPGRRTSSSSARRSPGRCWITSTTIPVGTTCRRVPVMSSSGVMWSQENKAGLLRHMPADDHLRLVRLVGGRRSRRFGVGRRRGRPRRRGSRSAENSAVFTDDGRRVEPGSGEQGMVAVGGFLPRRLLQGRGQDGADVPHHRGPPLERARRLRRGERRRHASTCSVAARCASTPAARRCSPRRSRRR